MKGALLAAFVLGALPIVGQAIERTDCVTEKIAGVGFTVCGGDRETLRAFGDRIDVAERRVNGLALTETLRGIACDAQLLEGDLSLLIDQRLAAAAEGTFINEAQLVAIAESGLPTLLAHLPAYVAYDDGRLSTAAWARLGSLLEDRRLDPVARGLLIAAMGTAGMERSRLERIARDRSDPVQFEAARAIARGLSAGELAAVVGDATNVLHASACLSVENPGPEILHALCRIALDHDAGEARFLATSTIAEQVAFDGDGCLACVQELLQPENLFTAEAGMNSATVILWTLPWEKARALALDFDINAARITDPAERDSLDALVFRLRANPHPPEDSEDYVEP